MPGPNSGAGGRTGSLLQNENPRVFLASGRSWSAGNNVLPRKSSKTPPPPGQNRANDSNGLSPLFTLSHKVFTCVSVSWLHSFNCSIHWSRSLVISLSSIVGDVAILTRPAVDFFPAHGGWLANAGLFHTRRTRITLSKTRGRAPNSIPPKNYNTAKSHRTRPLTRNSYYVLRKI